MTSQETAGRTRLLEIYLNDHLTGAVAGRELARRLSRAIRNEPNGPEIARLADEIEQDRITLVGVMHALHLRVSRVKPMLGWFGEKVGRLKLNDRLLSRSPLSTLIELEIMRLGVEGKAAAWRTLHSIADREPALDKGDLQGLIDRAERQITELEKFRQLAATEIFG